jgi:hypothetical protein
MSGIIKLLDIDSEIDPIVLIVTGRATDTSRMPSRDADAVRIAKPETDKSDSPDIATFSK